MAEEGCDGSLLIGNCFQKLGGGGRVYECRVGTSGHFLFRAGGGEGVSNMAVVLYVSHLRTVCQAAGMPVLTLPASEILLIC
jgi:hypothetical protein